MSLYSVDLIVGIVMLALGLIFIVTSAIRYQHPEVGTETAKVAFVMVGVGTFCLGLLVFYLTFARRGPQRQFAHNVDPKRAKRPSRRPQRRTG